MWHVTFVAPPGNGAPPVTPELRELSARERQIVDRLYELGEAGVSEVRDGLPDPPSYSATRTMLGRLEEKGYVDHEERDGRYVYRPTIPASRARRTAIDRVMRTFFEGNPVRTVAEILDRSASRLTDEEWERLRAMIEDSRRRGR